VEYQRLSTGLPGLDQILGGVLPGDNIVWEVDSIDDYLPIVKPYYEAALQSTKTVVYFRFASHRALIPERSDAHVHRLRPEEGFESFLLQVHRIIEESGRGAFYVFDCLSELAVDWYSDQMLANFFMLTCPYLFDLETVAYFPLLRNHHSSQATSPISETTQILIALHRSGDDFYLRPLKVQHRYSATMYTLHAWKGDEFIPVAESAVISEILSSVPRTLLQSGGAHLDIWNRTFAQARKVYEEVQAGSGSQEELDQYFNRLLRMAISRDERMLELCRNYFTIADIFQIGERIVGTGLIGGKSLGMLLARAILCAKHEQMREILENHDSFFVASDVFYTYLVRNGCWWGRESHRNPDTFLRGASEVRRQILRGSFPDYLVKQFSDMLAYYGQSPIIVRSSSLLEDGFGHAFAGKYESVFCANQGPEGQRMEDFMSAVRTIYASTMSERALNYRARRGLLDRDEQMSLLVQRVSGSRAGNFFYPELAGVGFSFNPFVWGPEIDPDAGVLRLVFGLGTRAVERRDDDYTRLVAVNAPERQPEYASNEERPFVQRQVDVLDLGANQLTSTEFSDVAERSPLLKLENVASRDPQIERFAKEGGRKNIFPWVLTFSGVLSDTSFVQDMGDMLKTLSSAYDYPVDVEFTANALGDSQYRINLVQCRPLQVQGAGTVREPPAKIDEKDCIIKTRGAVIGQSRLSAIGRLIYVVPSVYRELPDRARYSIARLVGKIAHLPMPDPSQNLMLIGPGRWGTTTPSLGVPIVFSEISGVSVLCELVAMRDDVVPDASLGTHFFGDLVEMNMLYMALFPDRPGNSMNEEFFARAPNKLVHLLPKTPPAQLDAVKVIDVADLPTSRELRLYANTVDQEAVCYLG
jgi:pyruvate,water dikinase